MKRREWLKLFAATALAPSLPVVAAKKSCIAPDKLLGVTPKASPLWDIDTEDYKEKTLPNGQKWVWYKLVEKFRS